uniref:RRM domain-containing protein n=1 Tax=Periophthalmus magnuspinnatus TaxID=409849 RepID=A0A3B4BBF3_9GOBI
MNTILQLRGLDTKANAEDIRSFFGAIHIPEGGVFIFGGALGEAFIAFNTEEDGMLAVQQSGQFLKDSKVDLQISRAEKTVNMNTLDSNAILLGVCTLLQGLAPPEAKTAPCDSPAELPLSDPPNPGFIRVFGLPCSTTKQDICVFFQGLSVKDVLLNVKLGVNRGCMVKFESFQDATEALNFNQNSLGSACVEVRTATEKMWLSALREHKDGGCEVLTVEQGPLKDTVNYSKVSEWPRKKQYKHNIDSIQKTSKKMKNCQTTDPSDNMDYIIMVSHLPLNIVKTEIKELFGCPDIAHSNVLHLLDSEGQRTDKVFVKFDKQEDYDYAVNLSGCHVGSNVIEQNPRNMPADVRRSQIKGLFTENKLKEEDITLLYDSDGTCIGEAVVQFQSQTNAALALMHHGREFLGSKILLTPISSSRESFKPVVSKGIGASTVNMKYQ